MCAPIFSWFLDACELIGISGKGITCRWSSPKQDIIDPQKSYEAYQTAVENNFLSHKDVIRELGDDPDDTYKEIAATKKAWKELGIEQINDA